jgi:hypothetical protein
MFTNVSEESAVSIFSKKRTLCLKSAESVLIRTFSMVVRFEIVKGDFVLTVFLAVMFSLVNITNVLENLKVNVKVTLQPMVSQSVCLDVCFLLEI